MNLKERYGQDKNWISRLRNVGTCFPCSLHLHQPSFELIAVTERSKELSREKYPDACIVRSFGELIGLEGLDLVVINTPDSTHYEYARRALEAGKHVVVEKPFTTTVAEAEELVALAASRGLTLSVYQNRRWDGDF